MRDTERFDTIVVGGGNAGLAAGYYLRQRGADFVILDGGERVGDSWRRRWDSLRLFTTARYSALPGMRLPIPPSAQATKDDMADYLESYVERMELPVRTGVRVDRLERRDGRFLLTAGEHQLEAASVVVATGSNRDPLFPSFSRELDPSIRQLHSSEYRNPSQLRNGGVLVVGAGNSGADIAIELVNDRTTWLSGPDTGHIPFDVDRWFARHVAFHVVRFVGVHVLTIRTPIGRRVRASEKKGDPLVRVKPRWLEAAGVERVPRTVGAVEGRPQLEDGRVLDVQNVVWCTGFRKDLSWIHLPIFDERGEVRHEIGVAVDEPGLAFVGLPFQFSFASEVLPGMNRDAWYVVQRLMQGADHRDRRIGVPA
ncbi:MAG TPA: NAD(P)-binding domain-containing protein [Actinomycetota bacterium]|nr:NAD(P)-binding domain-containing protein [Actinomycetota bacterium]